jgi:hypothetical protein
MKKTKVAICVPCRDEVMSGFCFDLAKLMGYEGARGKVDIELFQMQGTLIFTQREKLAEEAIKWGAEFVLWIDSDMRFPKNSLQTLLDRKQFIVGVNATTRREPIVPTAKRLEVVDGDSIWHPVNSLKAQGIEQITAVGFGMTMVKVDVFNKTPRPWFNVLWSDHGAIIGEDIHFCVKAFDAGFPTYVDHDLSKNIGHIGTRSFGWKDIENGTLNIFRPKDNNSELPSEE